MNTLLWHWYQSRPHIWFLRLRRRVPAAVLGKSWSLKQVQGCVLPGWGELVEKCFQACLKTGTWIYQVKEKYGALRFYIGSAPQWVNNLIHWAEVDSQKTCEICGQPGRARGEYWIKTLCDACLFPPYTVDRDDVVISDGYQTISKTCPTCGKDAMSVVRPGKFQCGNCE